MLDCYINDELASLIESESLPSNTIRRLPVVTADERSSLLTEARHLLTRDRRDEAEGLILRQFCLSDLDGATSFDLLYELYGGMTKHEARLEYWRGRAVYLIKH
jgi:hypothetical protein